MISQEPVSRPIKWMNPESKKIQRLEKKLMHYMGKAIHEFELIKPHDRILVCVSGGKDSITLLMILQKLKQKARIPFEIFCFTLDQSQPGWDDTEYKAFLEREKIPYEILTKDTYSVVKSKVSENQTYCGLCSRLRRGNIYNYAKQHGFNKIALGHHRDDLIQSLLMGIMYNGEVRSMPPKLITDDKKLTVIRPMVYVQEKDIASFASLKQFPIIPCNLCGSQSNLARDQVKLLITNLARKNPKIPSNMLRAIQNIRKSQLMDKALWNFNTLEDEIVMDDKEHA